MTASRTHVLHLALLGAGLLALLAGGSVAIDASMHASRATAEARHQASLAMAQGIHFASSFHQSAADAQLAHLARQRAAYAKVSRFERNQAIGFLLALAGLLIATIGYVLERLDRDIRELQDLPGLD